MAANAEKTTLKATLLKSIANKRGVHVKQIEAESNARQAAREKEQKAWLEQWRRDRKVSLASLLDTVNEISDALKDALGESVRFFIKGGAAVPLLLEEDYDNISNDIDTMLLIDPGAADFEEKRKTAMSICTEIIARNFPLVTPTNTEHPYELRTLETIKNKKTVIRENESSKEISFDVKASLLQLFKKEGDTMKDLLDIFIPNPTYPLLNYYWHTIMPIHVPYAEGKTVPVIDIVSAYINQRYAAKKSKTNINRNKRNTRANQLKGKLLNNKATTRKAKRTNNATLIMNATDRNLFKNILTSLPNNSEPASGGAGAGAGAAAGAVATLAPATPALPPLPPSPPLPSSPSPLYGKPFTKFNVSNKSKGIYLEVHRSEDGLVEEVYDKKTGRLYHTVVRKPAGYYNSEGKYPVIIDVRVDGVYYGAYDPQEFYFNPISLQVTPIRR